MFSRIHNWWREIRKLSIPILILVAGFATASWIDINGIWVELPLMVNVLPEAWDLPSYIVIIIQAANAGPLLYTVLKKIFPDKVKEWPTIIIIISIGIISCILLGFFWDKTTGGEVGGTGGTSTALFTLATFLAVVDCTSSVVFLPYMATFRQQYLNAFFVGEGLSGLVPAILGLIQGVGGDPVCIFPNQTTMSNQTNETAVPAYPIAIYPEPRFGVDTFYFILTGLLTIALISFLIVHFHPVGKRERAFRAWNSVSSSDKDKNSNTESKSVSDSEANEDSEAPGTPVMALDISLENCSQNTNEYKIVSLSDNEYDKKDASVQLKSFSRLGEDNNLNFQQQHCDKAVEALSVPVNIKKSESLLGFSHILTLLIVAWVNGLSNGVLPSIQSYSCLPYGNNVYNLANRLSVAANPIACFFGIFVTMKSLWGLVIVMILGTLCSAYHLVLAAMSPTPPLYDHESGGPLAITTFVLLTALFSYVKMCCAARLGERAGAEGLLWCGIATQVGSLIGAIIIFIIVNVEKAFTSKYPCT